MADMPTTAITMALALLLLTRCSWRAAAGAGALAGLLGLLRVSSVPLWFAGLVALATRRPPARHLLVYVAGSAPFFLAHAAWNWVVHGSPVATGYGRTAPSSGLFSPQYIFGSPARWDGANTGGLVTTFGLPNSVAYALSLAGVDLFFFGWPLVGVIGLTALLRAARGQDARGAFARFALAVLVSLYLTSVGYWYQAPRILMPAAALLNLSAAIALSDLLARLQLTARLKARLPLRWAGTRYLRPVA
jgi:hypothetical protein